MTITGFWCEHLSCFRGKRLFPGFLLSCCFCFVNLPAEGPERKSAVIEAKNRELVAYHEGGHALVALYTPGAMPIHKATIVPRGSALGMVRTTAHVAMIVLI